MTKHDIWEIIKKSISDVLPFLQNHELKPTDRLVELGANSMDRSQIIMLTLESLSLRIPLVELAQASNVNELCDLLYDKLKHD